MRRAQLRPLRILLIMAAIVGISTESHAFEIDTHYYLTFGVVLATCFDWDEAHLIASGNLMLDTNQTTVGEMSPFRNRNKQMWHAFGHFEEGFNRLWFRAVREKHPKVRLVKFGQFLHFIQDWEAHAGYPLELGHAVATITGRDPDSMAKNYLRTSRMFQSTLDHLAKMCGVMGRLPDGIQDPDIGLHKVMEEISDNRIGVDLYQQSNPGWRKPRGKLSKEGEKIVARNRLRIEQFIERELLGRPGKKVPADFRPGDEEHGIPEALRLRFDREGELIESIEKVTARTKELEAKDVDPADDEVTLQRATRVEEGWNVRLRVTNIGDLRSQAGELRLGAYDALTEEQLGKVSMFVPRLEPVETVTIETLIPTSRVAKEEMIAAAMHVGDLSMDNDQLWFMTQEDIKELQADLDTLGRPQDGRLVKLPVETVEFVGEPKLILYREEWLVAVITARTNLRHPSEELALPTVRLRAHDEALSSDEDLYPLVWTITAVEDGVRPSAKAYFDAKVSEICEKGDLGTASPVLEFTVAAHETAKQRRHRSTSKAKAEGPRAETGPQSVYATEVRTSVTLDEVLTKRLRRICTSTGRGAPQHPANPKTLSP